MNTKFLKEKDSKTTNERRLPWNCGKCDGWGPSLWADWKQRQYYFDNLCDYHFKKHQEEEKAWNEMGKTIRENPEIGKEFAKRLIKKQKNKPLGGFNPPLLEDLKK